MFTLTITFNNAQELQDYLAAKRAKKEETEEEIEKIDLGDVEIDLGDVEEEEITPESVEALVRAKVKAGNRDAIVALLKANKVKTVSEIKGKAKIEAFYKKVKAL